MKKFLLLPLLLHYAALVSLAAAMTTTPMAPTVAMVALPQGRWYPLSLLPISAAYA